MDQHEGAKAQPHTHAQSFCPGHAKATFEATLSYDVTFQLEDYYLSVLVFRHSLFENSPIMHVAFMIHERKFQSVHETFFNILLKQLPRLKKCRNLPIIIDREKALFNAIQKILPNVTVLLCWNHIKRDLAFFGYEDTVRALMISQCTRIKWNSFYNVTVKKYSTKRRQNSRRSGVQ